MVHFTCKTGIYYYIIFTKMGTVIQQIADTLTKKPEYGILSSLLSISMSATDFLQLLGVVLGLFIAIITAILKVMELKDKLRTKRNEKRKARRDKTPGNE